jgi:predicted transcriptional regulator
MAGQTPLTTYAELLTVLDDLPVILRETRRRLGLSQRAAAEAAGVTYQSINWIEQGRLDIPLRAVKVVLRWVADPH